MKIHVLLMVVLLAGCTVETQLPTGEVKATAAAEPATEPYEEYTQEETMEAIAITWVKFKLKDPDSAKFRGLLYSKPFMCGEVNAKNSFNGYSGFERFITGSREGTFLESELPPGDMDIAWKKYCTLQSS